MSENDDSVQPDVMSSVRKTYSGKQFRHTATINHGGTVIAFAMDSERHIYYVVLDLQTGDEELDLAFWPDDPREVEFPNEIRAVGYGILTSTYVPVVSAVSGDEIETTEVEEDEIDHFLSSTARFSALAPFQVFSNGKNIYLFRQSISANEDGQVFMLNDGSTSGTVPSDSSGVPVVNGTLLCDMFVLVGTELRKSKEVRFQRSRHKTVSASSADTLSSVDMDGKPFYIPTQQLQFISGLAGHQFSVLQLPTIVSGLKRWQMFVRKGNLNFVNSFNVEVSDDGLFNIQGSQLYTSPSKTYKGSVLERTPGVCPFTKEPLIPLQNPSGMAKTCLYMPGSNATASGTLSSWSSSAFTVELWIKGVANTTQNPDAGLFVSHDEDISGTIALQMGNNNDIKFSALQIENSSIVLGKLTTSWKHVAITYAGGTIRGYIDGVETATKNVTITPRFNKLRIGTNRNQTIFFNGYIDECHVWSRQCSKEEIRNKMNTMLTGMELGLVCCWRFDENSGQTVYDQCSRSNLTLARAAGFRVSDAPVGGTPAMRRTQFSCSGREMTGGITSCLYFEQEKMASGYSNSAKPMKKHARVMMIIPSEDESGSDKSAVCIDVGVSREGRIAQFSDVLTLSTLPEPSNITLKRTKRKFEEWHQYYLTHNRQLPPECNLNIIDLATAVQNNRWDVFRTSKYRDLSLVPLKSIQYDASGLSICGGLISFAWLSGGAQIVPSATGQLNLYYREAWHGNFSFAHFDTHVKRVCFLLDPHLTIVSRTGGSYAVDSVTVSGSDEATCTITIEDTTREITETWRNLPREVGKIADLLNGKRERPDNVEVQISLGTADVSAQSFLVNATTGGKSRDQKVQNGSGRLIAGKDSGWDRDRVGVALRVGEDTEIISLPASKLEDTAARRNVTVECWFRPGGFDSPCCLVHQVSSTSAYSLALERVSPQTNEYYVIAAKSEGTQNNHSIARFLRSEKSFPGSRVRNDWFYTEWTHLAMVFKQSYALQFSGEQYIDCGKSTVLDVTKDLTIEIFVKISSDRRWHGLIGKGTIGTHAVPYQVSISRGRRIQLAFEGENGVQKYSSSSTETLSTETFHRIVITRKSGQSREEHKTTQSMPLTTTTESGGENTTQVQMEVVTGVESSDFFDISFYIDGRPAGTSRYNGPAPRGDGGPLEIGRCRRASDRMLYSDCVIAEARIWDRVLIPEEMGKSVKGQEPGLLAWWSFEEAEGNFTADFKKAANGKLRGPEWVKSPDREASAFQLYRNGSLIPTVPLQSSSGFKQSPWGDTGFFLRSSQSNSQIRYKFVGDLDEVRVWNTARSEEQISDNLFSRIKGEKKDLIAYYTFDVDLSQTNHTKVLDEGLLGNHIPVTFNSAYTGWMIGYNGENPLLVVSSAPVSSETAVTQSALIACQTELTEITDCIPSVCEYSDMQYSSDGSLGGVFKRCYSYIREGEWMLITGYKIGNLTTEWVGQAQFDPQILGFVEGAPPVPSENLVKGLVASADDASVVDVVESGEVTYTISSSKERSWDASFKAGAKTSGGSNELLILAPFGFGVAKELTDVDVNVGFQGDFGTEEGWSQEESYGRTVNRTRSMSVATGGGFEAENNLLNANMGRRALPGNMGIALVQSSTADIFALRLAHTGALVSLRMLPNPDIPADWNIIPFPINPRYTKQGTLDGRIGFNAEGGVVLDPDYAGQTGYGEYSYYKPREAYRIEERIRRDEQRNLSYYREFDTGFGSTMGTVVGTAAGAAAGLMIPGAGPIIAGAALGVGISTLDNTFKKKDIAMTSAKRDMVNTYVWTADGGFFAETTETTDSRTEVTAGNFQFHGAFGVEVDANVEIMSFGLDFEFEAALGGGMSVTKTKAKESTQSFSLNVDVNVPGILQKHEKDSHGKYVGVFEDGEPVVPAGKVDAYRFKTFYLDASSENFDDLFFKVIDPVWLSQDNPNAAALRQAKQSTKKPPCWRVFHRVTFVSRILPEVEVAPQAVDRAMRASNISSNWQLIKKLEPFVLSKTGGNFGEFTEAIHDALEQYLPTLRQYKTDIVNYLALYYGMSDSS